MTTIRDEWKDFAKAVLPPNVSSVQRTETRRAFYAGCRSMLTLMSKISGEAANEDEGAAQIELLSQELKRFNEAVKEGRA